MLLTIIAVIFVGSPPGSGSTSVSKQGSISKNQPLKHQRKQVEDSSESLEAKRVKVAANIFVRRFRATLDFGTVFEEMRVSDAGRRLKKANFFQGLNFDPELVGRLDERTLRKVYESFMNLYYLRIVYDFGRPSTESSASNESRLPPKIGHAIESSAYKNLLSDPVTSDTPVIASKTQLTGFLRDLDRIALLYRQHLSSRVFKSSNYKANVRTMNERRKVGFQIKDGLPQFGIAEKTKVYALEQDIFIILFVEERGLLKILTFSPD